MSWPFEPDGRRERSAPRCSGIPYCAARLQTVDQGAPVSTYTVAPEMGHGGEAMVRRVYGHLGQVRHRAEAVEYRVEQHVAKLGARLEALRGVGFGTTIGTTA